MLFIKKSRVILGLFFLVTLLGCSIPTEFFIQNFTSSKQTIRINYKKGNLLYYLKNDSYGRLSFSYENQIMLPTDFRKNKNLKTLEKVIINDSVITIEIPANSTTRIDKAYNYSWNFTINSVEIQNENYTINELEKKSDKRKNDYIYRIQ